MKLLVAYSQYRNGKIGRYRMCEHIPNANDKPLCGDTLEDEWAWKVIDSQPMRTCPYCEQFSSQNKIELEKLRTWNSWAQSPDQ